MALLWFPCVHFPPDNHKHQPTTSCQPSLPALKLLFSHSVVSDSLRPHRLQHARLPCPSPSPRAYSNSCPLSWWCHSTISSSVVAFSPALNLSQHQDESALCLRWPKYWSFSVSISPSNDYSGLISFRMDWLDLLAVQGPLKNLPVLYIKSLLFIISVTFTASEYNKIQPPSLYSPVAAKWIWNRPRAFLCSYLHSWCFLLL